MADVRSFPRPDWQPVARPGCRGVEGRVLLHEEGLALSMLRFAPEGTVDEHPAAHPIDVFCLEGSGWTSIGDQVHALKAGQRIRWPADVPHRLWTDGAAMTTLLAERHNQ